MAAMKEMFGEVHQQVMECELEEKLGYEKSERVSDDGETDMSKNYRNGYSKKTVKTQLGEVDIRIPRDRKGEYEPQNIAKDDRNADGMEEKIIGLYACGMSQRDIAEQIKALYDVDISPELVSKISEKIMPEVTAWQNRPLEAVYPFIFLDAIHSIEDSRFRAPARNLGFRWLVGFLQSERESPIRDQGGLCGAWYQHGWPQGYPGHLDRAA